MRHLRAALRLVALLLVSAAMFPFGLATRVLALCGARRAALHAGAAVQAAWARGSLPCFGVRVVVEDPAPKGCFLIVSNHVSYVDILVLAATFRVRFVAMQEIAGWPLVGWLARSSGTLFVDRTRRRDVVRVGEEMRRTLAAGVSVLLFPEGGASRGARIEPFKTPLFEPPARERIPCLAVALGYETPGSPWGPAWTVCWWGGMDLARHAWRLLGMRRVVARVRCAPAPVSGAERKELAEALRAELVARFRPIAQAPAPPDLPWPALLEGSGVGDRQGG
jgi:1-acyl-sn-glycerol-3-phosphate acyltransferase